MTCCSARVFLLTICALELIVTIQRQVFDFLGYLWVPIIGNFIHIICVILGFFGSLQYRPKYIICYASWSVIWLAWNVFIMCFYLEVGVFRVDSSILNLGTGGRSWWQTHGFGCNLVYNYSTGEERIEVVHGCILDFQYVEVIHAAIQCFLTILGFSLAVYAIHVFLQEDDSFQANPLNIQIVPRDIPSRPHVDIVSQTISGNMQPPRPRRPREVKRTSHRSRTKQTYRSPVTRLMDRPPPPLPRTRPPPLPSLRPPPLPSLRPQPIYYPDSELQFYNISKEIVL